MIYLIGGAPRCGKTILAKKLAAKKKISWISTDSIWSIIKAVTPEKETKKKFPGFCLACPKNKYHFEIYDPQLLAEKEIIESETIWPGIKAFIKYQIDFKQDFIVEGINLLPKLVNQLKKTNYWKDIKIVYLVKTDLDKIKQGIPKNKKEFDWILAGGIDKPGRLDKAAAMIQYESLYFKREAEKYGFNVVDTSNGFNQKLNKLV